MIRKILLIQTAYLGDVILTTPLIRSIKSIFSDALLDVLLIPQTAGALVNNPHINQLILFDKRQRKWSAFGEVLAILKARHYDLAISPHCSLTTGLLLKLAKIPQRIGFKKFPIRFFLTTQVPIPNVEFTIQKYLTLLSPFVQKSFSIQTELFPLKEDWQKAEQISRTLDHKKKTIVLAPGSVWPTKRWPAEYYVTLTAGLKKAFNLIFVGSKEERLLCQQIIEQSSAKQALNLAGELNILQSAAVIARSDLMICNDSGALHMANAMQTDVFAIFGPTVRSFGFFPFRENDKVFEITDLYCRPCGKHGHQTCPEGHFRCMLEIKPETVLKAVFRKLEK